MATDFKNNDVDFEIEVTAAPIAGVTTRLVPKSFHLRILPPQRHWKTDNYLRRDGKRPFLTSTADAPLISRKNLSQFTISRITIA